MTGFRRIVTAPALKAHTTGGFIFTQDLPESRVFTELRVGDALMELRRLPDRFARCILTSPPYRAKFCYGVPGECGLEPTLDGYLGYLTDVGRELRRIATDDANFFLVIGDTYNGSGGPGGDFGQKYAHATGGPKENGLPVKSQLLVPERLRIALSSVGWVPRLRAIWNKEDARRGAVDRPSYSYEEVLIFSASPKHYWNREAVLTPFKQASKSQLSGTYNGKARREHNDGTDDPSELKRRMIAGMQKRQGALLKAVWNISSGSQPVVKVDGEDVHGIASFPQLLADICISIGSAPGDVVVDPFVGMGTTMLAATKLGRQSLGIELSERFAAAAEHRMKDAGF